MKEEVFPIVIKVEEDDLIRREITVSIIDSEEITLLCGKKTLTEWKTALYFVAEKLKFNDNGKNTKLMLSEGGHMLINMEKVGE